MEDGDAENRKPWELMTAEPFMDIEQWKREVKGLQGKRPENIPSVITAIQ